MKIDFKLHEELPVIANADVVVVGGRLGGIGAAVAAARNGADTLLVETSGFLGGTAVASEVHPFMDNNVRQEPLDAPVFIDLLEKMHQYYPPKWRFSPFDRKLAKPTCRNIIKDVLPLAAEELVLAAKARVLYHHHITDVVLENGQIQALIVHSKSGRAAIIGKRFIDSTGDGDLAALCNCPFDVGDSNGCCQSMTLTFKLAMVDRSKLPSRSKLDQYYDAARNAGKISCPRHNLLMLETFDPTVIHFNTTRVNDKSGLSGIERSEAEIEARKQLREIVFWLQNEVPGFEESYLISAGQQIGIRETRRIRGKEYLTAEAFYKALKFPDAIAHVNYPIDIHSPTGKDTLQRLERDEWYEIPYGCIVPEKCNNLLIGCRAISVDHAIHASMRIMPVVCSIGQAAGIAALLSLLHDCPPGKIDGQLVRSHLIRFGAKIRETKEVKKN